MTERVELAVVIPTIDDRYHSYVRTRNAYFRTLQGVEWRLVTVRNADSCGAGWQMGADEVQEYLEPDYIHLSADDLIPREGWFEAGKEAVSWGAVPGAVIHRPDGSLESMAAWETAGKHKGRADLARIPFCSWDQWQFIQPIPPIQYYSDNAFHDRAAMNGWPCLTHDRYAFIHHKPRQLRPGEQEQMIRDSQAYEEWRRSE